MQAAAGDQRRADLLDPGHGSVLPVRHVESAWTHASCLLAVRSLPQPVKPPGAVDPSQDHAAKASVNTKETALVQGTVCCREQEQCWGRPYGAKGPSSSDTEEPSDDPAQHWARALPEVAQASQPSEDERDADEKQPDSG